jgi:hypothetical protein
MKFVRSPRSVRERDVLVSVNVAKLDRSWSDDYGFYIGRGGSGAAIEGRYENFGQWFEQGAPIEAPEVTINQGHVVFRNGRHRFAWLRDHGVKTITVAVDKETAAQFRKLFKKGTSAMKRKKKRTTSVTHRRRKATRKPAATKRRRKSRGHTKRGARRAVSGYKRSLVKNAWDVIRRNAPKHKRKGKRKPPKNWRKGLRAAARVIRARYGA